MPTPTRAPRRGPWAVAGGLITAIIAASAVNAVIALLARAANAPDGFRPLEPPAYVFLTAVGVLLGALGWAMVRRMSKTPVSLLRWLVPAVVAVSFIPDFFRFSDGGAAGVAALLLMHIAVAVIAIAAYRKVMPLAAK